MSHNLNTLDSEARFQNLSLAKETTELSELCLMSSFPGRKAQQVNVGLGWNVDGINAETTLRWYDSASSNFEMFHQIM